MDEVADEHLRALLHQSPRTFGKPTSVWTLDLAAEVSFAEGITPERVSGETIRQAICRLGVRWKRAKEWITSPDPEYARKKLGRQTPLEGASVGALLRVRRVMECTREGVASASTAVAWGESRPPSQDCRPRKKVNATG